MGKDMRAERGCLVTNTSTETTPSHTLAVPFRSQMTKILSAEKLYLLNLLTLLKMKWLYCIYLKIYQIANDCKFQAIYIYNKQI